MPWRQSWKRLRVERPGRPPRLCPGHGGVKRVIRSPAGPARIAPSRPSPSRSPRNGRLAAARRSRSGRFPAIRRRAPHAAAERSRWTRGPLHRPLLPTSGKPAPLLCTAANATPWASSGMCGEATPLPAHGLPGIGRPFFRRSAAGRAAFALQLRRPLASSGGRGRGSPCLHKAGRRQPVPPPPIRSRWIGQTALAHRAAPATGTLHHCDRPGSHKGTNPPSHGSARSGGAAIGRSWGRTIRSCPPAAKAPAGSRSHSQRLDQARGFLRRGRFREILLAEPCRRAAPRLAAPGAPLASFPRRVLGPPGAKFFPVAATRTAGGAPWNKDPGPAAVSVQDRGGGCAGPARTLLNRRWR